MTDPRTAVAERYLFRPGDYETFRFLDRSIDVRGTVRLRYRLDGGPEFEERFDVPLPAAPPCVDARVIDGLLSLLHWVAGVSYYKTAAPPAVAFDDVSPTPPPPPLPPPLPLPPPAAPPLPPPAAARLLEAMYSEGLGEFAVTAGLAHVPRPVFGAERAGAPAAVVREPQLVLVPVGGGKDSAVAVEIVRRSGAQTGLFSIGAADAIQRTVAVASLPWLRVTRHIDPAVRERRLQGALNGHVPVTAIVSCVALLVAALHGYDAVALANERSASAGNLEFDGIEINHQYSKSARAEQLLQGAVAEITPDLQIFSVLRPASELAIARAFARLPRYHPAFTSCNRIFRLEQGRRAETWCCECDKCRFVFLILAPFLTPAQMQAIFGVDMLDDERQYAGFALLAGTGGHKPFECVGEVEESVAAVRLLAADDRWREHRVVTRLAREVLPRYGTHDGDPAAVLALGGGHAIPVNLVAAVDALLGP